MLYDYNLLFQFQYYLEGLNSYYLNNFNYQTIFIIFVLGSVSGINPCILSIFPVYNIYLNINNKEKKYQLFIGGIYTGINLVVILSTTAYNSKLYNNYNSLFIGIVILFLGYKQLQVNILNNNLISTKSFFQYINSYENTILGSYILGIALGFMGASCSTPSIVTLSLWLQNTKENYLALFFISIYSAGYILPIIFFNIIIEKINIEIKKFFFAEWFTILGSNIMITLGTYYILLYFD